jgi:hypothetical protein
MTTKTKIIKNKTDIIVNFISNSDSLTKKFKQTKNSKYTLNECVYAVCFKEYFNLSYAKYEELINEFVDIPKFPSRSQLNRFVNKLSKYKVFKQIHEHHLTNCPQLTTHILSIDSTFVPNKCAPLDKIFIGINPFYHNKWGCKVSIIANDFGYPLYAQIDASNLHDSSIAIDFFKKFKNNEISKHMMLADSGYDSSILKEHLKSITSTYIIPKNIRNQQDAELKEEITKKVNQLQNKANLKVTNLNNELSKLRTEHRNEKNKMAKSVIMNQIKIFKDEKKTINAYVVQKIRESKAFIKAQYKKKIKKEKISQKKKRFNLGLSDAEKEIYKKRSFNEHANAFIKSHRLDKIMCNTLNNLYHHLYSAFIDRHLFYLQKITNVSP